MLKAYLRSLKRFDCILSTYYIICRKICAFQFKKKKNTLLRLKLIFPFYYLYQHQVQEINKFHK